ncbi:hypothetical protein MC885_020706 [Smutsia gigantea]|nr:hypothetical protein MC885_020706 [Smutsia gigantea]
MDRKKRGCVSSGLRGKEQAEQSPRTLRLQEGDILSLSCTYPVSSCRGLRGFRPQAPLPPVFHRGEKQQDRLRATLPKKGSSLHATASTPEDSAAYPALWRPGALKAPAACPETLQHGLWNKATSCVSSSNRDALSTQNLFPRASVKTEAELWALASRVCLKYEAGDGGVRAPDLGLWSSTNSLDRAEGQAVNIPYSLSAIRENECVIWGWQFFN